MRHNLTKPYDLNKPEHLLGDFLAAGPCNSRDALEAMAGHGLTPKQVRRARELLGVITQRAGSGTSMHSVWSLPPTMTNIGTARVDESAEGANEVDEAFVPEAAAGFPTVPRPGARAGGGDEADGGEDAYRSQRARDRQDANCEAAPHLKAGPPAAVEGLNDFEQRRHQRRVEEFIAKGIDAITAAEVANALVARDRDFRPAAGSCAECQNLLRGNCPATPKPVIEIHECWYRRQDTP